MMGQIDLVARTLANLAVYLASDASRYDHSWAVHRALFLAFIPLVRRRGPELHRDRAYLPISSGHRPIRTPENRSKLRGQTCARM